MPRRMRPAMAVLALLALGYGAIAVLIARRAQQALAQPPQRVADAALVLGNRAYIDGQPNPCLTGRVDTAVALASAGLVGQLVMAGGVDREDGRVEAQVMAAHARAIGYAGPILREEHSSSTRANLALAAPILQAASAKRVIVVSEPFHLWRIERLAHASGFARAFELQVAAADTRCWRERGMLGRGALREPLAVIHNALRGDLF